MCFAPTGTFDLQIIVFFQCPHESICPRQIEKKHPCSFNVRFRNFPFNGLTNGQNDTVFNGKYSYIVAQKGNTDKNDISKRCELPV